MAVVHTNIQDPAAFQIALNAANAAGANLESAVLQGGNAFSEFGHGPWGITLQSSTKIQGFVSGAGTFFIDGSNLSPGSPVFTITHAQYVDNSPAATIDVYGNVTGNLSSQTGSINQVLYHSAFVDFSLIGNVNVQGLSAGSTFNATSFSIHVFGPNDSRHNPFNVPQRKRDDFRGRPQPVAPGICR
ncbi:MAG: hypothetical protein AABM33_11185 [Pseudomonadota bacterium]